MKTWWVLQAVSTRQCKADTLISIISTVEHKTIPGLWSPRTDDVFDLDKVEHVLKQSFHVFCFN